MSDDESEAERLLEEAKSQSRKDTEPTTTDTDNDTPTLEDAIADAYQSIDDGDVSSNLTLRDENLAALFLGLEETNQLEDVGQAALEYLDRDDDASKRAGVLRQLVRIALSELDDSNDDLELIDAGKEGRRRFLESDEF